jgi:nitrogen fixation/metabolism regulation signal transduction histidine kinase
MKLRTKYILFVVIIHAVALVLSYFILSENKILFIASEVFVLISIWLSWNLYQQLIAPVRTLLQGADAIREREFNMKFVKTGKYELDELINVYNDMMDQLRTERTKQEEQHFFLEKLIQTSPTGIVILDYDQRIHQLNPKAEQMLDMKENQLVGKSAAEVNSPILSELTSLKSGDTKIFSPNGVETFKLQKSHFIDRGFARSFVMIEELTAEILAAEKKAYGKVIRMMAHEVNNTIGPVNSIIQSTLQNSTPGEAIQHALQIAMDRNNNLNLFMRNFADVVRLPSPQKKQIDLHKIVESIAGLMQWKTSDKKINLEFKFAPRPISILADALQMEQALINIVKNAVEAIPEKGKIRFITTNKPLQLIIEDDGKPIPIEISDQLFSPFFSTKKDGQGIGLTLTREILVNHGYNFSLLTREDGMTEFRIEFD